MRASLVVVLVGWLGCARNEAAERPVRVFSEALNAPGQGGQRNKRLGEDCTCVPVLDGGAL